MSKISLSSNILGTGTLTIASPNTDSDATINLPTVTGGSFIVSDASGNVGIGTGSPGGRLDVAGGFARFQSSAGYVSFGDNGYIRTDSSGFLQLQGGSTGTRFMNGANDSERMRITDAGNVGIGTSSPVSKLNVVGTTTGTATIGYGAGTDPGTGDKTIGALDYYGHFNLGICASIEVLKTSNPDYYNGNIIFKTRTNDAGANTERARIDSSGNLLVNRTSNTSTVSQVALSYNANAGHCGLGIQATVQNDGTAVQFINASGTVCGTISQSTSTTAYNTSSDYRLKHDIAPMTGALARVAALKPCTYKWNADDSSGEGFIAHELQEVCPDAVTGEKDAVNEDGSIKPQGIDTSFLVATLAAAIQELNAKVDAQAAEIAALKGQA